MSVLPYWKPPQISGQELMQQGLKGPEVGKEIKRRTQADWEEFLKRKEGHASS
jgi:hypothetical protein